MESPKRRSTTTPAATDGRTNNRQLGKYRIVRELGRGAFGVVYLALDTANTNRPVAVKVLHPSLALDREFVGNFVREAQIAAQLKDRHIARVFDVQQSGQYIYLVMQYIEGETLADRIERGAMPLPQVVEIVTEIAEGLDAAHRVGFVHGDVKPSNILVDVKKQRYYLADFGLARARNVMGLSSSRGLSGTMAYISPEQAREQPVDERSDVYALATVAYEMLTGRLPFQSDTVYGYIRQHAQVQPPPPSQFNERISQDVQAVLLRGLAKDPDMRYASAITFAHALSEAAAAPFRVAQSESAGHMPHADTTSNGQPRNLTRPLGLLVVVLLTAVLLGGIGLMALSPDTVQRVTGNALPAAVLAISETPTVTATASVTATVTPTVTPSATPTLTPSATPTATATFTATPTITPLPDPPTTVFEDTFSNAELNPAWTSISDRLSPVVGVLVVSDLVPEQSIVGRIALAEGVYQSVSIEASITDVGGPPGNFFLPPTGAAVGLVAYQQRDGSAVMLVAQERALQFATIAPDGTVNLLVGSRVTEGINFDAPGRLRFEARGPLLQAYVDGELVSEAWYHGPTFGQVGIWMKSGYAQDVAARRATPKLDNLVVTPLDNLQLPDVPELSAAVGYEDTFDRYLLPVWQAVSGTWGVANGRLTLTQIQRDRTSEGLLVLETQRWDNLTVRLSVDDLISLSNEAFLFQGNSAVALLLRMQDDGSGIGFVIEAGSAAFARYDTNGEWTIIDDSRVLHNIDFEESPEFLVQADGNTYTAFVDGETLTTAMIVGPVSGRLALWLRSTLPLEFADDTIVPKIDTVSITPLR